MPLLDRFWQTRIALATFLVFVAIGFPLRFLPIAYVVDQRRHMAFWPDALFTAAFCVAILGLAIYFARSVQTARERVAWREAILLGAGDDAHEYSARDDDGDGMAAQMGNISTHSANRISLPLTLTWRRTWFTRIFGGFMGLLALVFALFGVALLFGATLALIGDNVAFYFGFAIWGAFVGPFIVIASSVFTAWFFIDGAWDYLRPNTTLIANDDGLTKRVGLTERTIRWEDMCLLERATYLTFSGNKVVHEQRYILYSRDAAITWDDVYSRQATYRQRAALLAIIERRGRLRPRAYK